MIKGENSFSHMLTSTQIYLSWHDFSDDQNSLRLYATELYFGLWSSVSQLWNS